MRRLGLYIHWPYCLSKCPYCDFNSHVAVQDDPRDWIKAYRMALDFYHAKIPTRPLHSIFFGGGTPSLMAPEIVADIIAYARDKFDFESDIEITLEANPTSVENEKFKAFAEAGINRVSIGVQALNDADLKFLGRQHDTENAIKALEIAGQYFGRFSFDLIYARPNQTLAAWRDELEQALAYVKKGAAHLSLYQLTIEPNTPFYTRYQRGEFTIPDEALAADMYELTQELTAQHGLHSYEVSNYAIAAQESRHNLIYWNYQDYIGIGPGAHGRLLTHEGAMLGTQEHRAPKIWLQRQIENAENVRTIEEIDTSTQFQERMMMGLRLLDGVQLPDWQSYCDARKVETLIENGDLSIQGDHWRLTPQGRLRLNGILNYLQT